MTDLVERLFPPKKIAEWLHHVADDWDGEPEDKTIFRWAADEIERLERDNAMLKLQSESWENMYKGKIGAWLDDIRTYAKEEGTTRGIFTRQILNDYCKDRGIL